MEQAHINGDCRPCAFYLIKDDGCRLGSQCKFCHLCPPGALKKKKKEKVKALKEQDYLARHGACEGTLEISERLASKKPVRTEKTDRSYASRKLQWGGSPPS